MELLSAYNFSLSYRRGDNANADFLSRLLLPPADEHISGSCGLTDADDLGVYLIRACGLGPPFAPSPVLAWVGWLPCRMLPQVLTWVG